MYKVQISYSWRVLAGTEDMGKWVEKHAVGVITLASG